MNRFRVGDRIIFSKNKKVSLHSVELDLIGKTGIVVEINTLVKSCVVFLDSPISIGGECYEKFGVRNYKLSFDPKYKKIKDQIRKEFTLKMLEVDPFREEVW